MERKICIIALSWFNLHYKQPPRLYSRSGTSTSASSKIACDFFIFLTQAGWVLAQVIECLDHVHFSHVLQFLAHLECDLTTNMLWNATLIHHKQALTTSVLWGTTLIYQQFALLSKLQLPCQIISYLQDQRYFVQGKDLGLGHITVARACMRQ